MASPSDEELTERFEETIEVAGARTVSVDGTSVTLDPAAERQAISELEQRRAARTRGILPIIAHKAISRGLQ